MHLDSPSPTAATNQINNFRGNLAIVVAVARELHFLANLLCR
jgi:hypothetical protein